MYMSCPPYKAANAPQCPYSHIASGIPGSKADAPALSENGTEINPHAMLIHSFLVR